MSLPRIINSFLDNQIGTAVFDVGRGERTIDILMTQLPIEILVGSMLIPSTPRLPHSATSMVNWQKIEL